MENYVIIIPPPEWGYERAAKLRNYLRGEYEIEY